MLRIGVLAGGGGRDDVSRQLSPLGAVDWFDRPDALVARAAEGDFDAVVTGLHDDTGRSVVATLVELAAYRPSLPVVLHAKIDHRALHELLAVFASGLRMECVVRPFAQIAPMLHHVLSPFYRPGIAPLLLHHFVGRAPASLMIFLALAAIVAHERRTVAELAGWSGVSARTIDRRLRREGWASAHVVLQSFTALDAIWLMTEYGWSARRVQQVRGFPHASSVTRLLAAYAGTQPSTLLADGGFATALEHVTRTLSRAR